MEWSRCQGWRGQPKLLIRSALTPIMGTQLSWKHLHWKVITVLAGQPTWFGKPPEKLRSLSRNMPTSTSLSPAHNSAPDQWGLRSPFLLPLWGFFLVICLFGEAKPVLLERIHMVEQLWDGHLHQASLTVQLQPWRSRNGPRKDHRVFCLHVGRSYLVFFYVLPEPVLLLLLPSTPRDRDHRNTTGNPLSPT